LGGLDAIELTPGEIVGQTVITIGRNRLGTVPLQDLADCVGDCGQLGAGVPPAAVDDQGALPGPSHKSPGAAGLELDGYLPSGGREDQPNRSPCLRRREKAHAGHLAEPAPKEIGGEAKPPTGPLAGAGVAQWPVDQGHELRRQWTLIDQQGIEADIDPSSLLGNGGQSSQILGHSETIGVIDNQRRPDLSRNNRPASHGQIQFDRVSWRIDETWGLGDARWEMKHRPAEVCRHRL
jgi:hypothetical protein